MANSKADAARMLAELCQLMIGPGYLDEVAHEVAVSGLAKALAKADAGFIYDQLMLSLSMQGISDDIATRYIIRHGNATRIEIRAALARRRCACPKLAGFEAYTGCRYRKSANTCARPQHLRMGRAPAGWPGSTARRRGTRAPPRPHSSPRRRG